MGTLNWQLPNTLRIRFSNNALNNCEAHVTGEAGVAKPVSSVSSKGPMLAQRYISCYGICYGFWQHENTRSCNISLSKTFAPLAQLAEQVTLNCGSAYAISVMLPNTLPNFRMQ